MFEFKTERQRETEKMELVMKGLFVVGLGTAVAMIMLKDGAPKNPDGPFEVVSVGTNKTIVKQDGKEYTISTKDIPAAAKQKLIEANPKLKSFLENGPITIVNTNK